MALGGGRQQKGDPIDRRVGVILEAKVGARVQPGDPLCTVHAADEASARAAVTRLQAAYTVVASRSRRCRSYGPSYTVISQSSNLVS